MAGDCPLVRGASVSILTMNSRMAENSICGEMMVHFSGKSLIGSYVFSVSTKLPATVPATACAGLAVAS